MALAGQLSPPPEQSVPSVNVEVALMVRPEPLRGVLTQDASGLKPPRSHPRPRAQVRKRHAETFTAAALRKLAREREGLVFLCWGAGAHKLADDCGVSPRRHLVLKSSHPSPLGATKTKKPFIGSRCFSKANKYLKEKGLKEIDWQVSEAAGL